MGREQHIIRTIAKVFEVEDNFLDNNSRTRKYVYPKKVLMAILTRYGNMSMKSASKFCGYKSHATAIYHVRDVDPLCFQFEPFDYQYKKVCDEAKKIYKTVSDEGTTCVVS